MAGRATGWKGINVNKSPRDVGFNIGVIMGYLVISRGLLLALWIIPVFLGAAFEQHYKSKKGDQAYGKLFERLKSFEDKRMPSSFYGAPLTELDYKRYGDLIYELEKNNANIHEIFKKWFFNWTAILMLILIFYWGIPSSDLDLYLE